MYLNDFSLACIRFIGGLIETRVVFELVDSSNIRGLWIWLIETRVVFELEETAV